MKRKLSNQINTKDFLMAIQSNLSCGSNLIKIKKENLSQSINYGKAKTICKWNYQSCNKFVRLSQAIRIYK